EQPMEQHEEAAFAQWPYGALRHRREHHMPEVCWTVDELIQTQPGEIILREPGSHALPIKNETEEAGNGPVGGAPKPVHLASKPIELTTIPNSRWSTAPGGMNLSSANSTLTASAPSADAGTSFEYT